MQLDLVWPACRRIILSATLIVFTTVTTTAQYSKKTNVAHRGASAYAPEHTMAAYRLALEMGADYVEQDLAVTRDGVLICLHDASLERTTNVEQLFPNRVTTQTIEGKTRQAWLANDFTLAEIKTLDAGSWFDPKFAGEKIPTFDEAIALIRGRAGIFPELKTPEIYAGRNIDFEQLVAAALDRNGLRGAKADPKTPVILQTFGQSSARKLAAMKIGVPVVLLLDSDEGFTTPQQLRAWKGVVQGFGPAKRIVLRNPEFVKWAHADGMTVTPYTFRSSDVSKSGFRDVNEEMTHFLYKLGVDAVFTDNPDKFPRPPSR
ncbi:MAG TPA: glycerophosphodiester phosphodiesterase family protein [Vicinamibacterales bacterium]|nr:glycerophosphodiester phosphodiesterase family protein [Vicinamibacterales bacterium]